MLLLGSRDDLGNTWRLKLDFVKLQLELIDDKKSENFKEANS